MKASIVVAMLSAALTMASPAAVSLNRATREVTVDGNTLAIACVECPCSTDIFSTNCKCVPNGCCTGKCYN
ncbi:hypothetical protein EJ04DRAFT_475906 [Polyplosphaeria fusca]|uniref:Uncharacterized protein n=1 Tax=Polyplosphaeria fusca TaxID=682080 RepID=A0A9P4QPC9_9PLEO|nr:hypothetical protein EJ04DRAFT_475906 [Polyplosphaeria fusca]